MNLPPEIIENILFQLDDIDTIGACYVVCKDFLNIMRYFDKKHGVYGWYKEDHPLDRDMLYKKS